MSLKTVTDAVEIVFEYGRQFEKLGDDISQGDWIDLGMDALQLGIDIAEKVIPADELDKPLPGASGETLAADLVKEVSGALAAAADKGHLTVRDILKSAQSLRVESGA